MNIHRRLQIEFEFLGDEKISANTALKIINDVFKEAESEQFNIPAVSKSLTFEGEQCKKCTNFSVVTYLDGKECTACGNVC